MDNKLNKIFHFKTFQVITVVDEDGNPWFRGKDVATILGYSNTNQAII